VSVESLVSLISGGSGALTVVVIWLTLILSGKMHTDTEFDREVARGDKLEEALKEKDRALEAAIARADTAVHASSLIAEALTGVRVRGGDSRAIPSQESP